jgi:hypothetical protein
MQYTVSQDHSSFADLKFLATGNSEFDTQATSVVVGNDFYFIAHSQLLQLIGNQGEDQKSGEAQRHTHYED